MAKAPKKKNQRKVDSSAFRFSNDAADIKITYDEKAIGKIVDKHLAKRLRQLGFRK